MGRNAKATRDIYFYRYVLNLISYSEENVSVSCSCKTDIFLDKKQWETERRRQDGKYHKSGLKLRSPEVQLQGYWLQLQRISSV